MEIKRLDVNKWAVVGEYKRRFIDIDSNFQTSWSIKTENFKVEDLSPITYTWFNIFGIPELTDLTVLVPKVSFSEIAWECGGELNLYNKNDFAFFTEWFFDKVVKLDDYGFYLDYGRQCYASGAADIIKKYFDWGASFSCPSSLLSNTQFVLYIKAQKLFEDYWNEDVRQALIDNIPIDIKYRFKKLDKIKDAVPFAAELLRIKAKYYDWE